MRILQINKYHYKRGGSDAVYFNTTKLLEQKGHEVHHFAMSFEENLPSVDKEFFVTNNDFENQNVLQKVKNINSFFYSSDAENKLRKLLLEVKPDVAHLHIFYGSLTSATLKVLKEFNIPAVVSVHDYKFVCPNYLFLDGDNKICERCLGGNYINCALHNCVKKNKLYSLMVALESYYRDAFYPYAKLISKFIFVSDFSRNIHIRGNKDIAGKDTRLYNFDPNIESHIPDYKKGDYYLYAGRLSREKGVLTLLNVFRGLPRIKLKIIGNGPMRDDLTDLPPNIEYCGFKNNAELEQMVLGSKFVIVPSEWYENNPMAIIESYSLGKPVIAAAVGGIPEIVENNKTGYLFETGSEIDLKKKILSTETLDSESYLSISKSARLFAEKQFDPESHYTKLIGIYSSVI